MDDSYPTQDAALAAVPPRVDVWRRGRRYVAVGNGEVRILQHPDETWRWAVMEKVR